VDSLNRASQGLVRVLKPEATPVAGRSDWGCDYVGALAKLFDYYTFTTLHQHTEPGSLFALCLQVKLVSRH
jgi:hypothetical protein